MVWAGHTVFLRYLAFLVGEVGTIALAQRSHTVPRGQVDFDTKRPGQSRPEFVKHQIRFSSIPKKFLKPLRRQCGIARRVLDVTMPR
jgi:hypothetical protein